MIFNFIQFAIIYFVLLAFHIIAVVYFPEIEPFTKPFLMLMLGYWLVSHRNRIKTKGVFSATLLALFFSLVGDELMVFEARNPMIFILGTVAFLIAHLFFIKAFNHQRDKKKKVINPFFIGLALQALFVVFIFNEHLIPQMKAPIFLYAIVIMAMANYAYLRKKQVDHWNWVLGIVGAFCFIFSDILLAYNAFIDTFYLAPYIVLTLYGAAQFLLVKSIIYSFEAPRY